jgi:hypothetical protein
MQEERTSNGQIGKNRLQMYSFTPMGKSPIFGESGIKIYKAALMTFL